MSFTLYMLRNLTKSARELMTKLRSCVDMRAARHAKNCCTRVADSPSELGTKCIHSWRCSIRILAQAGIHLVSSIKKNFFELSNLTVHVVNIKATKLYKH